VIDNVQINGKAVVLQLWMGWCQRFLGMDGMPGGVGAEVGVYRRIPGQFQTFLSQFGLTDQLRQKFIAFLRKKFGGAIPLGYFDTAFFQLTDSVLWWPFPELNTSIQYTLTNRATQAVFFEAGPETTYWLCKWMMPTDYDSYALAHQAPPRTIPPTQSIADWQLDFTVAGQKFSWNLHDGKVTFP